MGKEKNTKKELNRQIIAFEQQQRELDGLFDKFSMTDFFLVDKNVDKSMTLFAVCEK